MRQNNKHDEHEDRFTGNALLITFIILIIYIVYSLGDWSKFNLL